MVVMPAAVALARLATFVAFDCFALFGMAN
jgi:hypothetical protein